MAFGSSRELVVLDDRSLVPTPSDIHAFVLDAISGSVVNQTKWQSKWHCMLFGNAAEGYVVVTEKGTSVWSAGMKEVTAASPETGKDASPDGSVFAAWSGEFRPGHGATFFLDTQTLKPTGVEVLDTYVSSVSRDHMAHVAYREGTKNGTVLYAPEDDAWKPYDSDCPEPGPLFVTNDLVAVFGCRKMRVVDTSGSLVFTARLGRESGSAATARDGSRFAVFENTYTIAHWPKLVEERFTVFDVKGKGPIAIIKIDELRGRTDGNSGAALSPDGSLLAVNSMGVVRLYALPPK
ncbi:MAG: hypothetical protein HY049_18285 [Acidobacteria bacterium]|nr:hypothetical protein [Acidobacteriota bacterium]